jgi:alginate O-acetyltransferase complex protein AlgI
VVRALRTSRPGLAAWIVVFVSQVATMVLIGLWHGITWGFAAWGLWHGLGLFLHNRWAALVGGRMPLWAQDGIGARLLRVGSTALTFVFVSVGWVFFSFQSPAIAWQTILRLFGAG